MITKDIVIAKTWRSELSRVGLFIVLSIVSIFLTKQFPGSVITGPLFSIGETQVILSLPLFWFLPAYAAFSAIYRIYNVRYSVDGRGIEAKVGILGVYQRIIRVRFEDIRSVETEQTIMERAMNIGNVEIGTAATGDIEIIFDGIAAPSEVQDMIQNERDRRQKLARRQFSQVQEQVNAVG